MTKESILKELVNHTKDEVKEIFANYIKSTNQYPEYIRFISELSSYQQKELERKLTRTKMCSNAIQHCLNGDIDINNKNWFIWMRYLDVTEDSSTETLNIISPIDMLQKLGVVLRDIKIKDESEYEYLYNRFLELKAKYKLK